MATSRGVLQVATADVGRRTGLDRGEELLRVVAPAQLLVFDVDAGVNPVERGHVGFGLVREPGSAPLHVPIIEDDGAMSRGCTPLRGRCGRGSQGATANDCHEQNRGHERC